MENTQRTAAEEIRVFLAEVRAERAEAKADTSKQLNQALMFLIPFIISVIALAAVYIKT